MCGLATSRCDRGSSTGAAQLHSHSRRRIDMRQFELLCGFHAVVLLACGEQVRLPIAFRADTVR
jgi:hypothetical protein